MVYSWNQLNEENAMGEGMDIAFKYIMDVHGSSGS